MYTILYGQSLLIHVQNLANLSTKKQQQQIIRSHVKLNVVFKGKYKSWASGEIFWPVSQQLEINFIFTDKVHILSLPCNIKMWKSNSQIWVKRAETSLFQSFCECPLSCPHYTITVSYCLLYMNLISGDCYTFTVQQM